MCSGHQGAVSGQDDAAALVVVEPEAIQQMGAYFSSECRCGRCERLRVCWRTRALSGGPRALGTQLGAST